MDLKVNQVQDAKHLASKLRQRASELALPAMPVSASLELVSVLFGHSNWDTMSGVLKKGDFSPAGALEYRLPRPRTLYVETLSAEGPRWAKVEITQQFLETLAELAHLVESLDLSELRRWREPEAWESENDYRLRESELIVSSRAMFWFRTGLKQADDDLETVGLSVPGLIALLKESDTLGTEVIVHALNVDDFKDMLDGSDEVCFCRNCSLTYAAGGDGYDGMCPDCADKAEGTPQD